METHEPVCHLGRLSSNRVRGALTDVPLIIPAGAIEQHGPHLPLTVDVDIPLAVAEKLVGEIGGLISPPLIFGARSLPQSGGGPSLPGTVPVKGTTLIRWYAEVLGGLVALGGRHFLIVNGHYENEPFLTEAIELLREGNTLDGKRLVMASWWNLVGEALLAELFPDGFPGWAAEHAALCETSLMLHIAPETVGDERVDHLPPSYPASYIHPVEPGIYSNRGVLSTNHGASAEKGRRLLEDVVQGYGELAREVFSSTGTGGGPAL